MHANTERDRPEAAGTGSTLDPILREIISISGNAFKLDRELRELTNETGAQEITLERISRETGASRQAAERSAAIASSLSEDGGRAKAIAGEGIEAQKSFEEEFGTIQSGMAEVGQFMTTLEAGADRIRELSALLEEFGNQLNILSINTSIEAARAGQAGKGFAVIAREMKNLYAKVNDSASGVGTIVGSLRQGIESAKGKITSSRASLEKSRATVRRVSANLDDLGALNDRLVAETREIAELSSAGIGSNRGIDDLAREIGIAHGTILATTGRAHELAGRLHGAVDSTLTLFSGHEYPWHATVRAALAKISQSVSENSLAIPPAKLFAEYPWMELVYIMDSRGIQTSENLWNPAVEREGERDSGKGENRSQKAYFRQAMQNAGECAFSDIYLSCATDRLCCTVSLRVGAGSSAAVLAVDINLDGILKIGK